MEWQPMKLDITQTPEENFKRMEESLYEDEIKPGGTSAEFERLSREANKRTCKVDDYAVTEGDISKAKDVLMQGNQEDKINHPSHYTRGQIECIDAIEDWGVPYHLGNVIKYVCRAGHKDKQKEIEDLKKAQWYLNRYISLKEKNE